MRRRRSEDSPTSSGLTAGRLAALNVTARRATAARAAAVFTKYPPSMEADTILRSTGHLLGDLRSACRALVRQPTFSAVAIATLVLGIGTNTAIFSVIKAVLLNALPYPNPSRLVVLWEQNPDGRTDLVGILF